MSLFDEIAKFARKPSTLKQVRSLGKAARSKFGRKAVKSAGLKMVRTTVKKLKVPKPKRVKYSYTKPKALPRQTINVRPHR